MSTARNLLRASAALSVIAPFAALLCASSPASATPILGPDLSTFAVLGASTVTNLPFSTIGGNVGVSPGTAITGFPGFVANSSQPSSDGQVTGGMLESATPLAGLAHSQLTTAITNLGLAGPATTITGGDLDAWQALHGGHIIPGVYAVPALPTNLVGTLVLDGLGNANAGWIFQMSSTLKTSSGSVVTVTNTGSGVGVYWVLPTDAATIGSGATFLGNILAQTTVTMDSTATDLCGRVLADTAAVNLHMNTIDRFCTGVPAGSGGGSGGMSGGFDVTTISEVTTVTPLPFVHVGAAPEPATLALFGAGLAGLGALRRRRKSKA